jgi:hypothetical protein
MLADDFRQSYPYAKTQLLANPGAQGWLDEISTEAWEDSRRVLASIASDPSVTLAGPLTPGEMTAASGIVGPGPTASPSAFTGLFVVPDDRED